MRDPWVDFESKVKYPCSIQKFEKDNIHSNTLGVDGCKVSVLEQRDEVGFGGFLKGHDG